MLKKIFKGIYYKKFKGAYDMEGDFIDLFQELRPYTMTSLEKMYALYRAIQYVSRHQISGDIVECGVWRGGSCMLCARMLMELNATDKSIYLYDTYEGMTKPSSRDIDHHDEPAFGQWEKGQKKDSNRWCHASLEDVRGNLLSTGYPPEKLFFVKGDVKETIPKVMPQQIALLRLDTDWFGSTYHELQHLFPRLSQHGILIIDDYGYWQGAKQAVDRYFEENRTKIFLNRIDASARLAIKID